MNTFDDLSNLSNYFRNLDRSAERPLPARRMQILREIISNYNENVRLNNQQMMEYHQNMREILDMVRSFPDLQPRASSIPTPTPSRNTNRLNATNIYPELSTLLYLLSNSIDYNTTERQTPPRTESLSRSQIQTATRNIHYTTDLSYNVCPISLEDFVEDEEVCQIKQCGHVFKKNSIMRWFSASHVHCPVCRYDLRNYREPTPEPTPEPIEPNTNEANVNNNNNNNNNNTTTSENRNTRYVQDISGIFTNLYEQLFLNNMMDSDSSGNLVYTFEFPVYYTNYR
jgi:hypothetical protein